MVKHLDSVEFNNRRFTYTTGVAWSFADFSGSYASDLTCMYVFGYIHVSLIGRYLARKYFMLWAHRVYGRALPSAARAHWRAVVVRRAFRAWQEAWWVARREWKLTIRAECHDR